MYRMSLILEFQYQTIPIYVFSPLKDKSTV